MNIYMYVYTYLNKYIAINIYDIHKYRNLCHQLLSVLIIQMSLMIDYEFLTSMMTCIMNYVIILK